MMSHFELITQKFLQKFVFQVTNPTLKNIKFHFELLTRIFTLWSYYLDVKK